MAHPRRMFSTLVLAAAVCAFGAAVATATAAEAPAATAPAFWTGTPLANVVEQMRANCDSGLDSLDCMKFSVAQFLDKIFTQENFGDVQVRANGAAAAQEARADGGVVEAVERYVESHDVTIDVPVAGAKVTVSPKNIAAGEMNVSVKFAPTEGRSAVEARKSKLKKIVIPIMVFVLLKAMTLIPLALGVLGLKAFNALQLSFFSFVASIALAIFQLCKKIATDNHHPQLAAHAPWELRSFGGAGVGERAEPAPEAQQMAYGAYANY